jgi:hypothetical protein
MPISIQDKALKAKQILSEVGIIATSLAAIGTAYFLYMNNLWTPSVTLVSADYQNGTAQILVNGSTITLYLNEKYACGWGWDVEFGTDYSNNLQRVQLVKNLQVYQVLSTNS